MKEDEPESENAYCYCGNAFYEIDEECMRQKMENEQKKIQKKQRELQKKRPELEDRQENEKSKE